MERITREEQTGEDFFRKETMLIAALVLLFVLFFGEPDLYDALLIYLTQSCHYNF